MSRNVRVLLADDQRLVRESLGTLLGLLDGIELVASASNGEEAITLTAEHHPEVVLMDLRMPQLDGIEATRRLRAAHPEVHVIALTTFADDESVLGALRAGARGYLTKDASSSDIQAAILTVAAGEAALDPAVQHHVVAALAQPIELAPGTGSRSGSEPQPGAGELPDDLTQREAEVLALIAAGLTNAEIAERLVVSPTTIKSHINQPPLRQSRPARPSPSRQLCVPNRDRHPAALTTAETRASAQAKTNSNQAA